MIYFFTKKFPSWQSRQFFIAGYGYAGKTIPDLALKIYAYNSNSDVKINLIGILVGNGVMDLSDDQFQKNQINYMFTRNFIDPTLSKYWEDSCQLDPESAGCQFFIRRYDELLLGINLHNIHGKCYSSGNRQ